MYWKYLETAKNTFVIKSNTYRYEKYRKEKAQIVKMASKMDGTIHSMEEDGHSTQEISPIIHMAKTLAYDAKSDDSDIDSNSSECNM